MDLSISPMTEGRASTNTRHVGRCQLHVLFHVFGGCQSRFSFVDYFVRSFIAARIFARLLPELFTTFEGDLCVRCVDFIGGNSAFRQDGDTVRQNLDKSPSNIKTLNIGALTPMKYQLSGTEF